MAQMNQSQVKYVRQRAESMYNTKRSAILSKYRVNPVYITNSQKLDALRVGKFSIDEKGMDGFNRNWYSCVVFEDEVIPTVDTIAQAAEVDALYARYNTLMDELVLGDNEVALELLKAFELG